jgi:hypothetical protein
MFTPNSRLQNSICTASMFLLYSNPHSSAPYVSYVTIGVTMWSNKNRELCVTPNRIGCVYILKTLYRMCRALSLKVHLYNRLSSCCLHQCIHIIVDDNFPGNFRVIIDAISYKLLLDGHGNVSQFNSARWYIGHISYQQLSSVIMAMPTAHGLVTSSRTYFT